MLARFGAVPYASGIVDHPEASRRGLLLNQAGALPATMSMTAAEVRSAMAAPIRVGDACFGLLYVDRLVGEDLHTQRDVTFLCAMADQLAVRLSELKRSVARG